MKICVLNGKLIEASSKADEGELLRKAEQNGLVGAVEMDVSDSAFEVMVREQSTYQQKRAALYPPIADYLDAIVKNDNAQLQRYVNRCLEIKLLIPKN